MVIHQFSVLAYRYCLSRKDDHHTKLDKKLEGADKFRAWKNRVMLILEENDLEGFIEAYIPEPEEEEAKAKHKRRES